MRLTRPRPRAHAAVLFAFLVGTALADGPSARRLQPAGPGAFEPIATLVDEAIARGDLPGAVILVGRADAVLYEQPFGRRAVAPKWELMTADTVFDLASLTKVVATTTSVLQLVESGRLRLDDPVARFIPAFAQHGKGATTIRQLLTHVSGLPPDLPLADDFHGSDEAVGRASALAPDNAPGEKFVYSDVNFLLLGEIVARVSGERLDRYTATHIFGPLGMRDTMFLPPASLAPRIAPTERCAATEWPCRPDGPFLRGVVHDPTARRMDGVAGHAGLFSTAADLSRFCRMLLNGGALDGVRILSSATVATMTSPSTPATIHEVRGLGWDIDSPYSSNRGDLFGAGSFGHTGFTGTSLWIDPRSDRYVVFLSNRVHPVGKGDVTELRGRVATIAAAAVSGVPPPPDAPTLTGIDVLEGERFASLSGRHVGLLTNQTGRTRGGTSTIDALAAAPGIALVALFSPEHGIRGQLDENVPSSRDERTGLPVYSLYGDTLRPTQAMLNGIDQLVVDLQDSGARFYTYPAAMAYLMEEAATRKIPVMVLDRPNPVNGTDIEGPLQDAAARRYTGYLPMPIRHGMTMGELARLFNAEAAIGADLTVVPMRGWRRDWWFDRTSLLWVNPSPNMRTLVAAALYPGVGAIEGTNISVGRGTDTPFEQLGAPWVDGVTLASVLNARGLPGVRFYPVTFTPAVGAILGGQRCSGVFLVVTDRSALAPVRVGLEVASALARLYGGRFKLEDALNLFGSADTIRRIRAGEDPGAIAATWRGAEEHWRQLRARYLLY